MKNEATGLRLSVIHKANFQVKAIKVSGDVDSEDQKRLVRSKLKPITHPLNLLKDP